MNQVRFGMIGLGGMGALYAEALLAGKVSRAELTAVSDVNLTSANR